jgi:hypothetical protein
MFKYSPQYFDFSLTYRYVLPLEQHTKFQINIKEADLKLLTNVNLVTGCRPSCNQGQRIVLFTASKQSLGLTQSPTEWVPGFLPTTRPHLVPMLRIRGAIPQICLNVVIN